MIVRLFFHDEFLPQSNFLRFLVKYACDQNLAERKLCADFIFAVCGFDREQFDYDVKRLYRILPNVVDIYEVPLPKFNHVDFVWAKDAPKLVYERVLKLINAENPNNITLV
ncbi:Gastric triacylglycerol lipase [Camponotus floridanus]|uniref:Gastric triacylglycerol lipase n=1 Tax=Camponotus floridanus TaxID=104421 RepID=E2AUY7_CAMFO|nr:Gastric triacylglycerol lipase [Camponotus floridanus]